MLSEILAGCAAYALAMYGLPRTAVDAESGDTPPSARPNVPGISSRPTLQLISPDIGTRKILSLPEPARTEQIPRTRSGWRTAIAASRAAPLLSKIRKGVARRRAIAELRMMDDRSLRDIGISRADIDHIARYGVGPE